MLQVAAPVRLRTALPRKGLPVARPEAGRSATAPQAARPAVASQALLAAPEAALARHDYGVPNVRHF